MKYLPTTLTTMLAFGMLAVSMPVLAQDACEGQTGAAFGLCNAYCEAMDCDSDDPQASDQACVHVLDNFVKLTGTEIPPCSGGLPQQGESCVDSIPGYQFNQGEGLPYGCDVYDTAMSCNSSVWACYNGVG